MRICFSRLHLLLPGACRILSFDACLNPCPGKGQMFGLGCFMYVCRYLRSGLLFLGLWQSVVQLWKLAPSAYIDLRKLVYFVVSLVWHVSYAQLDVDLLTKADSQQCHI